MPWGKVWRHSRYYLETRRHILFKFIPWDTDSYFDPTVFRIHFKPHRLVEVKERRLHPVSWFVHFFNPFACDISKNLHKKCFHFAKTFATIIPDFEKVSKVRGSNFNQQTLIRGSNAK